jgi:hypothetical protein
MSVVRAESEINVAPSNGSVWRAESASRENHSRAAGGVKEHGSRSDLPKRLVAGSIM